jgi:hypothetical protein
MAGWLGGNDDVESSRLHKIRNDDMSELGSLCEKCYFIKEKGGRYIRNGYLCIIPESNLNIRKENQIKIVSLYYQN